MPFSIGSSSSWSTDVTTLPFDAFRFVAMPVMPDNHGMLYDRSGSNGGLACAGIRFELLGMRLLSSFSSHSFWTSSPGKRELSVITMMSRSIPRPWDSGPWIFPKYEALSLMSSK